MKTKLTKTLRTLGKTGVKLILTLGFVMCVCTVSYGDTNAIADETTEGCNEKVWDSNCDIKTVDDLKRLSGYTTVTGTLRINETSLSNLDGLECLTRIEGGLDIACNSLLTNIDGLKNLTFVDEWIIISCNDILNNIDSLAAITSIDTLMIINNDTLPDLNGLRNLVSVRESLVIVGNDELSILNLDRLKSIGDLALYGNVLLPPYVSREIIEKFTGATKEANAHNNYEVTGLTSCVCDAGLK